MNFPSTLIVVDVQKDFCEGGSLPVAGGNDVAERIAAYIKDSRKLLKFDSIIATKDWHLPNSTNDGHIALDHDPDFVLDWPPHCIQHTEGAEFHDALADIEFDRIFYKGQGEHGYSGFDGVSTSPDTTWLDQYLWKIASKAQSTHIEIVGLAFDYCVAATALGSLTYGFIPTVRLDFTAGVSPMGSVIQALEMQRKGVILK